MTLFLDILFAWIALGLGALLIVIFLLRIINKKFFNNKKNVIYIINKFLRKHHKTIGMAIIVAGFFHGLFSSKGLLVIGLGMIVWVLTILLALTFVFKKKLNKFKNWYFWHRALSLLFVVILVWHIVDVGGFIGVKTAYQLSFYNTTDSQSMYTNEQLEAIVSNEDGALYKDGVYEGVADGYGPDLTVKVTIENGLIAHVIVMSHNEKKSMFYDRPIAEIPVVIVNHQTPLVDTISGATFTSVGIINATINALNDAVIDNEAIETMAPVAPDTHQGRGKNNGNN